MKKHSILIVISFFLIQGLFAQNGQLKRTQNTLSHQQTEIVENQQSTKVSSDWEMDFEDIENFSLEFDPWTTIDGDQGQTYGITDVSFPHSEEAKAFMVFNPASTTPSLENDAALQPHGGEKFGACFSSVPPKTNNDWLISPQLVLGSNSSISFYVKSYTNQYGLDKYEVAVSVTGNEMADFTVITDVMEAPSGEWTAKNIGLGDFDHDTVYVAIHCVSEDNFIFMIDDISINTTLGIANQDAIKMKVFPNPVSETVFVEAEEIILDVEITDNAGRLLIGKSVDKRKVSLDISELANGICFLRITTKKGSAVRKIQKY
jgi:hypothetical protein